MKKRILSIILTFSICLSMFSFSVYADAIECPYCGGAVVDTGFSVLFGTVEREMYYCEDCKEYLYTSISIPGTWFNFSTGDAGLLDEYYDTAYNGTGGSFSTTTDDDGNTTTDYVANETDGTWYVTSDGQIQGKFVATYGYFSTGVSLTDGYGSYTWTATNTITPGRAYFRYSVSVPYSGSYTYSYTDFGFFVASSTNALYSFDSSDFYINSSSTTIPSSIVASTSSVAYVLYFDTNVTSDDDNYFSLTKPTIQIWSPILYLTYDPTAYGFISNDYSSVTVNGDIITGDSVYYYDYTSNYSNVDSSYSGAYYVYDSSDSGNYTVYNTNSSGDVVSSYYYDNSTGDTITYMTIYESDTFTDEEMYPTDTDGDDDSTSSGSGSSSSSDSSLSWLTDGLGTIFNGLAEVLSAVLGGVINLLVSLVDELLEGITTLVDTLFSVLTEITDFGGEFTSFLGGFFAFLPSEIVTLLCLSISLSIIFAIIKFFRG